MMTKPSRRCFLFVAEEAEMATHQQVHPTGNPTMHRLPAGFAIGIPLLITIGFIFIKLFQHYIFFNSYDAGIYSNLSWNIAHGNGFWSDIIQQNHLGVHFSPIMALFGPIYRLYPSANVLMVAQGLAAGATIWLLIPLCGVIMKDLSRRRQLALTSILVLMYIFYRPMTSAFLCQFHPCTLGMPLVAASLLCLHYRKTAFLAVSVFLLLLTKEMAVLTVIGLALYARLVVQQKKTAFVLGLVACLAALLVFNVVMPCFREGGGWGHVERFVPFSHCKLKLIYLVRLLAPLAFLPLIGWRAMLSAIPLVTLNLIVDFEPQFTVIRHYDDQTSVFLIVSAIHGARRVALLIRNRKVSFIRNRTFFITMIALACTLLIIIGGEVVTLLLRKTPVWSQEEFHTISSTHRHLKRLQNLPPEIRLVSHSGFAPYLCNRARFMLLKTYLEKREFRAGDIIVFSYWRYPHDDAKEVRRYLASHPRLYFKEMLDTIELYCVQQNPPVTSDN